MEEKQKPKGTGQGIPSGQRGQSEPQQRPAPGQQRPPTEPQVRFPKEEELKEEELEEKEEKTPVGETSR